MCGIAGYFGSPGIGDADGALRGMTDAISHRGPDDSGVWADAEVGVWLGHRRLSILDLSAAGHQPMRAASGRFVIVFNGEVYNHLDLRRELDAGTTHAWRGHSDTETLLAGFDRWGVKATLERAIGMFALALWDRQEHTLTLARDRLGEKPLYYGRQGGTLLFGSELKALRAHPSFRAPIDRDAITLLLRHNYIPAPHCIYRGVAKLLPGTLATFGGPEREPKFERYWSAAAAVTAARAAPFTGGPTEAVDALEALLRDAIRRQMVADVPLGAFLSGGIDSSTVVALMQAQSSRPVKTFSIGFHEAGYNEAEHAKAVADHLGTEHTELYVTPQDALAVVPRLPQLYDEPFSDSSQIPTFLVARMARQHVTVSLSGDAGDELFGGYERYRWAQRIWSRVRLMPHPLRRALARSIAAVAPNRWDGVVRPLRRVLPRGLRFERPGDTLHKLAEVLAVESPEQIYHQLVSHWKEPGRMVVGATEPVTVLHDRANWATVDGLTHRMMFLDLISYLPDDILVKVDRAAMGVSLETRVPMLDHRVVEFAWSLPLEHKVRDGVTKWVLREVLHRHVPRALMERPKMGFGVPIDAWLRGPLRQWACDLLAPARLRREGYFDPRPIGVRLDEHLSGTRNWQYHLWDVLMFQAWLEAEREGLRAAA